MPKPLSYYGEVLTVYNKALFLFRINDQFPGEMILWQADWVNTEQSHLWQVKPRTPYKDICNRAECRDMRGWLPQPPKGKRHTQRSVPVCSRPAAGCQHTYPPDLFRELSLHLGKPHTYSHKCIGIEKDCRGCGSPGVALFFTSPGQLFRPSLLHWLEALFTPSWVTHHIILPYKNK